MKRGRAKKKGKKANYEIVPDGHAAYKVLRQARQWHDDIKEARVALAWRKETKADKDGHIVLGKCVKVSALQKEFAGFDFIVVLNLEFWNAFDEEKRLALMDHELYHATQRLNGDGEHEQDERGRYLWRCRKHDIKEFRGVVERHGCYKRDLEEFAKAIREAQQRSPQLELAAK